MNAAAAKAWRDRWKLVHEAEVRELQTTPTATKFQQLSALMASVDAFGWRSDLEQGVDDVRTRWNRLREIYGV